MVGFERVQCLNFFKLYIGDYQRDTAHLSVTEHGAYQLMLQHHYATEKPLPTGKELHRMLRAQTKIEREAIDRVAAEFWVTTPDGLINERAKLEIARADHQRTVNQQVGKLGGRPKTPRKDKPNENRIGSQTEAINNPTQTPDTRHSEPNGSGAGAPPDTADHIFGLGVPLLTASGCTDRNARSMLALLHKQHGGLAVVAALERCAREKPLQPIPWLQAVMTPKSRHTGFEAKNYREGVAADGSL